MKVEKNPIKLMLLPQNRMTLVLFVIMLSIIVSVFTYVIMANTSDEPVGGANLRTGQVATKSAAVATGRESEEYLKKVHKYNEETLIEKRKDNPSAHPLPVFSKINPDMCKANHDAWIECLRSTGTLGQEECSATDTQCMLSKGFIGKDQCAPADLMCKKLKGIVDGNFCDPSNIKCIAERALKAGCDITDTACLIENGILPEGSCAVGDPKCVGKTFSFCDINDLDCIETRANAAGCDISDTECLRAAGIIAKTACAPGDSECRLKNDYCNPSDIACVLERARKAGCQIDDTACLRAAGIISPTACAAGDKSCVGEVNGFCDENDHACILRKAREHGCDAADTQCLREKGIIAKTACAPSDVKCRNGRNFCKAGDLACIKERAAKAGCKPEDSKCLRAAGIIPPNACSPLDKECIKLMGAVDSGVCATGTDPSSLLVSNQSSSICEPDDVVCISKEARKAGCSLSDTACLRAAGIIPQDACAPADIQCRSNQKNSLQSGGSGGLVGGSSRDNRYANAARLNNARNTQGYNAYNKSMDEEYMSQVFSFIGKTKSRKPNAISIDVDEASRLEQIASTSDVESNAATIPVVDQPIKEDKGELLVKAGQVKFGISNIALSSDYEGPVSLTIVEPGALYGANALGSMVRLDDKVRLELKRLILEDGEEIKIEAVALDPVTTYAAVSSRVNNHIIYRYGWWGVGTALSAIGQAAEISAEESVIVPNAGVATGSNTDSKAELKIALGKLGAEIGETMADRINRPPTVEVDVGEEMGLFFIQSVYK